MKKITKLACVAMLLILSVPAQAFSEKKEEARTPLCEIPADFIQVSEKVEGGGDGGEGCYSYLNLDLPEYAMWVYWGNFGPVISYIYTPTYDMRAFTGNFGERFDSLTPTYYNMEEIRKNIWAEKLI